MGAAASEREREREGASEYTGISIRLCVMPYPDNLKANRIENSMKMAKIKWNGQCARERWKKK